MDNQKSILIAGTTPQGLQAALTLGRCDRRVLLVEEESQIRRPGARLPSPCSTLVDIALRALTRSPGHFHQSKP